MILTGFNRVPDPVNAEALAQEISDAIGKTVTWIHFNPTGASVEGSITESDRAAIQAVIDAYTYEAPPAAPHGHAITEVTNLQTSLDAKAASSHTHAQADVTNLTSDLAGKAASSHTHAQADITNLTTDLAGKAASSHTHSVTDLTATGTKDNTTFLRGDNTWATPAGGGSNPWTRVVLAADVVNNNAVANTIANVTGLSFAVTSGTRYHFKFVIIYTAAATTTGSRWSISGPASPTGLVYTSEYSLTTTTTTRNATLTAYDLPAASNLSSATTGPSNRATIEGFIQPSASGTLIARFASEVLNSAITAKAGSYVEYSTA